MLFRPTLHDLITNTTHHDQRRNQGERFGHKKIITFCPCFRVIYNWNFNWRLHPLNERAIGATMLQMIDRDINFHILQKKNLDRRSTLGWDWQSQNPYIKTWRPWQSSSDSSYISWSARLLTLQESEDIDGMGWRACHGNQVVMTAIKVLHI